VQLNEFFRSVTLQDDSSASPAVRICTQVFIPLIKSISRADPSVYSTCLDSLQEILNSSSSLALRMEPRVIVTSLQDFLESISQDQGVDRENRKKVFNLLLSLGATFGTLSSWLSVIRACLSPSSSCVFPLTSSEKVCSPPHAKDKKEGQKQKKQRQRQKPRIFIAIAVN
jgi:hypothetical protein